MNFWNFCIDMWVNWHMSLLNLITTYLKTIFQWAFSSVEVVNGVGLMCGFWFFYKCFKWLYNSRFLAGLLFFVMTYIYSCLILQTNW